MKNENNTFDLTIDSTFKAVILDDNSRGYLVRLIGEITGLDKNILKDNLKVFNNESSKRVINEKRKIKDIVLSYNEGVINIEMNKFYYEAYISKNTSYIDRTLFFFI